MYVRLQALALLGDPVDQRIVLHFRVRVAHRGSTQARGGADVAYVEASRRGRCITSSSMWRPLAARIVGLCLVALCVLGLVDAKRNDLPARKRAASDKVALDSIKALTFYRHQLTASRRTDPIPQLTCQGNLCLKFAPRAVQCVHRGDGQWKVRRPH